MKNLLGILSIVVMVYACNDQAGDSTANLADSTISGADTTGNIDTTATLNGTWYLQPVLPSDTGALKTPQLTFDLATNKFTGSTGCNSMSGTFIRTDSTLEFNENILLTKMACTGYNERAFIENLLRTNSYRFKNGLLVLQFNETELSKWGREPVKPAVVNKA